MSWSFFGKKKKPKEPKPSETSKVRNSLTKFCVGDGIDIGFGGDPIVPTAICIDLPTPYGKYKQFPQHLHGDARNLKWFRDECLDYVYSSHVLEDFEDTASVLKEWLRVLKPGGRLILFLPDEQTYRKFCHGRGKAPNPHHIHDNFSLDYMKALIKENSLNLETEYDAFPVEIYSFVLVLKKKSSNLTTNYGNGTATQDKLIYKIYKKIKDK